DRANLYGCPSSSHPVQKSPLWWQRFANSPSRTDWRHYRGAQQCYDHELGHRGARATRGSYIRKKVRESHSDATRSARLNTATAKSALLSAKCGDRQYQNKPPAPPWGVLL